jgi:hypothetical protein
MEEACPELCSPHALARAGATEDCAAGLRPVKKGRSAQLVNAELKRAVGGAFFAKLKVPCSRISRAASSSAP